jgi:drug/metabolite transporter (DMT)-like permease
MDYFGELAAIGAATCWALTAFLFGFAGARVGAFVINTFRIPVAALLLFVMVWLTSERIVPLETQPAQLLWLAGSGIIGLVIGDYCYFRALLTIGPRLATLLMTTAPIFATVVSWLTLGEHLRVLGAIGVVVTLAGVAWVILERQDETVQRRTRRKGYGLLMGCLGGLGQAVGLVMTKIGMGENISALHASLFRMAAASVAIWILASAIGKAGDSLRALRDRRALTTMIGASIIGPFMGIWLSLLSIQYTNVGIAATLMSLSPVLVIPMAIIIHKERPSFRAILGTFVAMAGVAMIFSR